MQSIVELIQTRGCINIDFADARSVLSHPGRVLMGSGSKAGENRVEQALKEAISSPLLKGYSLEGAKGLLVNILGSSSLTMEEFGQITELLHRQIHEDAEIFVGLVIDETMQDEIKFTVVASGLENNRTFPSLKS